MNLLLPWSYSVRPPPLPKVILCCINQPQRVFAEISGESHPLPHFILSMSSPPHTLSSTRARKSFSSLLMCPWSCTYSCMAQHDTTHNPAPDIYYIRLVRKLKFKLGKG